VLDASGGEWASASTPEEALADYRIAERRDALQAALKFEGDTMGHCVGQYCDEVGRGDTNIYSLRDRRGEPHVTIETKKYYGDDLEHIAQIKGKQNAAPNEKYLPAIQDFVRSQDWSMVHDLPNSGLLDLNRENSHLHPELQNIAKEKFGRYATDDEIESLMDDFLQKNVNFAKGGSVQALHAKYEESDYGYGNRPDKTKKGLGYFGELERPDGTGVMTEYSIGVPINGEEMDVPTLIPTLTPDEIRLILHMQDGEDMPRSIVHKAIDHAHQRLSEGKPIFATEEDLYAHGGIVDVLHNDAIEQIMKAFMDSMEDEQEEEPAAVSIQITTHSQPLKSGKIPTSIREAKHG
jgi:5'-deoxynucleotidase YfbR-like HD superfamily hydrolase